MDSMKGVMLSAVALLSAAPFVATAEDTHYQPGNLALSIGVGAGFGWGFTLSVYPGIELIVAKTRIADAVPLDFGVAAKALLSVSRFGTGWISAGVGVLGTVHWGLRGMDWDLDVLDPVDVWLGIGLAVIGHTAYGGAGSWPFGGLLSFATAGGVNWFLTDGFALTLAGNYWGYGGGYVGVLVRLGKGQSPSDAVE